MHAGVDTHGQRCTHGAASFDAMSGAGAKRADARTEKGALAREINVSARVYAPHTISTRRGRELVYFNMTIFFDRVRDSVESV